MTSKVEASRDQSSCSSPKLPIIAEGRSLVSPTQGTKTPTVRDQVNAWARTVMHSIEEKLNNQEDIDDTDIAHVKTELLSLFISALQKDNRQTWMFLREALLVIAPYKNMLPGGEKELSHYLERVCHHLEVHKERLFDLHVMDAITKVFPKEVKEIQDSGTRPKKNYNYPSPPKSSALGSLRKPVVIPTPTLLPGGKDIFQLRLPEEQEYRPKPMTFGDLRASLPDVALQVATREAIWSACLGTTAMALNTDLPEEPEQSPPPSSRSVSKTPRSAMSEKVEEEMSDISEEAGPEQPSQPLTGREAVEYFSKCYHTGKIKFMYFNIAPSRYFKPYDLVAVPKNKVNKEHYVFSTFGVLHVYPDQPSINMSLADWQKEAVLFKAISTIPFFKNYLVRKMFDKWRANVHFAEYCALQKQVSEKLIQAIPTYGAAILQISRLCEELLQLTLLPNDTEKCYMLLEFDNAANYTSLQAEKVLEKFFRYTKIIVDTTAEELLKKVRHCQEQAEQKAVFSRDSLHRQRIKKEQREQNLRKAKDEMSQLGNFIHLVDQMLLSYLVKLARGSLVTFVEDVMSLQPDSIRDGLFRANLVFTNKDVLSLAPVKEKFMKVLTRITARIPAQCCEPAETLEEEQQATPRPAGDHEGEMETSPTATAKVSSRHASMTSKKKKVPTATLR